LERSLSSVDQGKLPSLTVDVGSALGVTAPVVLAEWQSAGEEEKTPSKFIPTNNGDGRGGDESRHVSIGKIAEIVAGESLAMDEGKRKEKEQEMMERARSSTMDTEKSWRGMSTTSVD
jgi:hypothetical protein